MEVAKPVPVPVDREVGDGPDDLPEEPHDGADVEELELEALVLALDDFEPDGPGGVALDLVVPGVAGLDRSEEPLAELGVTRCDTAVASEAP